MPNMKLPSSIVVVVESDVLGKTAVSVPATPFQPDGEDGDKFIAVLAEKAAVEDAVDELETRYLESHEAKVNPFEIDREELRRQALAFVEEHSWQELAARAGWIRKSDEGKNGFIPDGERMKHVLGFRQDRLRATLTGADAQAICDALGIEYTDIGL